MDTQFVKLTLGNGAEVCINPHHVTHVYKSKNNNRCIVHLVTGKYFTVKGDIDNVRDELTS